MRLVDLLYILSVLLISTFVLLSGCAPTVYVLKQGESITLQGNIPQTDQEWWNDFHEEHQEPERR